MMGCRHGAKNTLDLNYLYLAEKRGVQIFPETKVSRCAGRWTALPKAAPDTKCTPSTPPLGFAGSRGVSPAAVWFSRRPRWARMELLFHLREKGSLPAISERLGKNVRTNSESLIGVRVPGCSDDLSKGIAIGSGVYIDEDTHIEAVRYPNGSDAMSLLSTLLTGRPSRVAAHCALAEKHHSTPLLRHPCQNRALVLAVGMGARKRDSALHAGFGRPH